MSRLKSLPSVSLILEKIKGELNFHENYLKLLINRELGSLRHQVISNDVSFDKDKVIDIIITKVKDNVSFSLVNIINGTGIVLHTGFGRAPFDGERLREIADRLDGYINLEYDIINNHRGDRQKHINEHISSICDVESSLIVNNNAAALLLTINSLADNSEVICSRGQIVEIGGSFRISDIIKKGGATLKEVGATNRTHIDDYESAITHKTKMLLWVHTSNYILKGYTKQVPLEDIVKLGKKHDIPVLADLGSGTFLALDKFGLPSEAPLIEIVKKGPDIILFSGDKMLGGPQSGIILASRNISNQIKSNTLYRTVRCDKITITMLDQTIRTYTRKGFSNLNLSLSLLTTTRKDLEKIGKKIINNISSKKIKVLGLTMEESFVEAGSGSLPEKNIESIALKFNSSVLSANELSLLFKGAEVPIIGYIQKEFFFIDLKAILPSQISKIITTINNI